jgi:hypothetical protein
MQQLHIFSHAIQHAMLIYILGIVPNKPQIKRMSYDVKNEKKIKYQIHLKKKCIIFLILDFSGPNTDYGSLASFRVETAAGASRRCSPQERLQLFVLLICFKNISGYIFING